jgi:hypothetical protein
MKSQYVPLLLCLSAVAPSVQANAAQEYMVTTGPAGIWVLNVRNTSYVATVPGDPFVPTPLSGTVLVEDQPLVFGLDPTGEYLYADYNTCLVPPGSCNIASNQLFSFKMVNGIPYQISRISNFDGRSCAGCPALFNSIIVSAHYVFVMKNTWDAVAVIYSTTNGVLAQIGYLPMPGVTNPLSLQVDAADHFAYLNYNNDNSFVNTVADHVAIYDLTPLPSHPARLIVTKPQVGGVLVGAQ